MADHKRKKKRGRSMLFKSCFRSFSDERPFRYNNNNNSDIRNSGNGRSGKPGFIAGCQGDDVVNSDPSSHGRAVPRLLKAALFGSVMVKKICSSSKPLNALETSKTLLSINQSDDSNACDTQSTSIEIEDSSSRCSNLLSSSRATSSLYSSSSSSSTNSNSKWLSEPKTSSSSETAYFNNQILSKTSSLHKPNILSSRSCSRSCFDHQTDTILLPVANSNSLSRSSSSSVYNKGLSQLDSVDLKNKVLSSPDKIKSGNNNWNIRWCLFILLSLIVLVVYGRIYAILCTSMWFYLIPCRRVKRVNSVGNTARVIDTESEQYKKRVIMAGLLDRTCNPLR